MTFEKRWKKNWELQSLSFGELFNILTQIITKQLDDVEKNQISLGANLIIDYEIDSVDLVAMLISLEEVFKNDAHATETKIPTDKIGGITLVEDLFDVIYEVLMEIEKKLNPSSKITPDYNALEKQKKKGKLYSLD